MSPFVLWCFKFTTSLQNKGRIRTQQNNKEIVRIRQDLYLHYWKKTLAYLYLYLLPPWLWGGCEAGLWAKGGRKPGQVGGEAGRALQAALPRHQQSFT